MANGGPGPIPDMPLEIWETIKDLDLTDGGWVVNQTTHYLYLVRTDALGGTAWDLLTEAQAPAGVFKAPMSSGDWSTIKGGELIVALNKIEVGETEHRIEFYNDSGTAKAKRIDV